VSLQHNTHSPKPLVNLSRVGLHCEWRQIALWLQQACLLPVRASRPPLPPCVPPCSERAALSSQREAQQAELQVQLQEELLAQKAALEQQQAALQAQLDRERAVVSAAAALLVPFHDSVFL